MGDRGSTADGAIRAAASASSRSRRSRRLLAERRRQPRDRPIVAQSARNRFPGIVTRVERDGVAAVVEVIAGPHRLVSLMTAEAVEDLDLKVGDEAVCVVKATNVIVEIPSPRSRDREVRASLPCCAVLLLVLAACSSGASRRRARPRPPATTAPDARSRIDRAAAAVELTILGAASLKGALEQAKAAYEAANPGTTLTISTDSSAALETQIEQGAPADVFLSADTKNPQKLVDAGLAAGGRRHLRGQPAHRHRPDRQPGRDRDAGRPRQARASRSSPPATRCRSRSTPRQLVDNLAKETGYPADFAAAYAANVVSKEDNVKAVVAKVELGEGDAGIVYVTDATASDKVTTDRRPRGRERPGDLRRRRGEGIPERGRGPGVPRLARRSRRPGDPRLLRVPAAPS